jgi:RND family efflux transporter MFP subunit
MRATEPAAAARRLLRVMLPLVIITACGKPPAATNAPNPVPPVSVKLIAAGLEALTPEVSSFGSISFRSKADIATTVEGTVKRLARDEGDHVKAGDVLAELENVQLTIRKSQAESQLRSARAAVELARAQLWEGRQGVEARLLSLEKTRLEIEQKKREADDLRATLDSRELLLAVDGISAEQLQSLRLQYQSARTSYEGLLTDRAVALIGLRDQDIRTAGRAMPGTEEERVALLTEINTQTLQAQLEAAQANLQTAVSDLQAADALLGEMTIRSPVDGIIGARQCGVGERVQEGDALFTLIDDAQVYAVFTVAENKGVGLSAGMPVRVEVPSLGNRLYRSAISIVSPVLDPQSGNLTLRALLPNRDGSLKPGLFIRVRVQTGEARQAFLLPKSALVSRNGAEASVYLVRDGRSFKRAVTLGPDGEGESAGKLEVRAGIAEGDQVVDEPSPVLRDGGDVDEAK